MLRILAFTLKLQPRHSTIFEKVKLAPFQATNTGGDLQDNHFDMAIPGCGVGYLNGCTAQYNAPKDGWGKRYGGISQESECSQLPAKLQPGCKWRWDWYLGAQIPHVTFKRVKCPKEITDKSQCIREDDDSFTA